MSDLPIEEWKKWARQDNWYNLFVGSDIRQMLGEIELLRRELQHQKDLTEGYKRIAARS